LLWGAAAAVAAVALWFVFAYRTYEILGFTGLPGVTLVMMVTLLPLLPALAGVARNGWPLTGLALLSLAGLLAATLAGPAFTDTVPRPLNLLYAGDERGGRLFADALPAGKRPQALMSAGRFAATPVKSLPWSDRLRLAGKSGPSLQPPGITVVRDTPTTDGRRVRLNLQTRRDARVMYLLLPEAAKPEALTVQGLPVTAAPDSASGWRMLEIVASPAAGVRIDVELHTRGPVTLYAADYSDGLPAVLDDVVDARDAAAVPVDEGDRTVAWKEVQLPAR
jgi:hypothetical protein